MADNAKEAKKEKTEDKKVQAEGQQDNNWESLMGRLDKITESLRTACESAGGKDEKAPAAPDTKQEKK